VTTPAQAERTPAVPFTPAPGVVRRMTRHHHAPLRALAWVAAVDIAAMLGHLAIGFAETLPAIAGAGGVVALRTAWTHRRRRTTAKWYAAGAVAAGVVTALVGARWGATTGAGQVLILGGGLGYAGPWLRSHRRKFDERQPSPSPVMVHLSDRWPERDAFHAAFTAERGAPLHDAMMERPVRVPNGWQAPIQLVRGKQTTADVVKLQDKISSLYGVPFEQVVCEHDASRARDRALLTVITDAGKFITGERWSGCVRLGYFADSTPTRHRLHTPGSGGAHVIVTGCTGAGKSALLGLLLAEAGNARVDGQRMVRRWILDPQAQSLPVWTNRVDLTALGVASSMAALRALWQALKIRSAHLGRMEWTDAKGRVIKGRGTFDPAPDLPLWMAVVDEAHLLIGDATYGQEATWLLANASKLGRKVGLSLVLGTQLPTLAELKDRALRQQLAGMGAVCLRSGERLSAGMVGVEGDPFSLPPDSPGLCFTNGPDRRSSAICKATWIGGPEEELDAAEAAGTLPLDRVTADAVTRAAAHPLPVLGSPKFLPSWAYTGNGQVLRDAA
jgi:hypothetical protein